jgi:primosomal protein N' (replication factor Y)
LPLKGLAKPLWYQSLNREIAIGKVVLVPMQAQVIPAIVVKLQADLELPYEIRHVVSLEDFPDDSFFLDFIKQVSCYHQIAPLALIKRFRKFIEQKQENEPEQIPLALGETSLVTSQLTNEQQIAYDQIALQITKPAYQATILHGVTGSGKTEVYKKLIEACLKANKSVILLLPEVALAIQFEAIFSKTFTNDLVLGFHSASSAKQKKQLWQALINHQSCLIIGVHLPILLPIANLGLIIIDEEHETGYQEKKHPCLNSKDLAIMRAHTYQIPIVLGSATPSISSLHNLKRPHWQIVTLTKRFGGDFPQIKLVQIGKDQKQAHFLISQQLKNAIHSKLAQREQVIIFLNRRGYSFFVQCAGCKFIFHCPHCAVSLTLHQDETLRCHYCEFKRAMPVVCSACDAKKFIKKGVGTQQIVTILTKLFPEARIARADLDTTSKKKEWQDTVAKFTNKELDILVGTQTITKGYHFPGVTLVGILWADINLHLPIFNAAEVALQQILQVAGRAGRSSLSSEVIVQAMLPHPIFNYLQEELYLQFYDKEIQNRILTNYPPIARLVEIELRHFLEKVVEQEIYSFYQTLEKKQLEFSNTIEILGPVKPVVSKLKNWHMRKIYLKSIDMGDLIKLFKLVNQQIYKSKIFFTPNPLS